MPELELSSREAKYVVLAVPKLMCGAAVRALVELATLKIENLGTLRLHVFNTVFSVTLYLPFKVAERNNCKLLKKYLEYCIVLCCFIFFFLFYTDVPR